MLPKAERIDEVFTAACVSAGKAVLPMIESAVGLSNAQTLARAQGVERLVFGSIDFQLDMGIPGDDLELLPYRAQLVVASRLARIAPPVDGVTTAIDDAAIPTDYGGSGLSMAEASVIMEEINRCGGNSGACHGQMYVMNAIVRSGSQAQKAKYLPRIATGELRIQAMGVTEPSTGSDTTKLKTLAVRKNGRWVINGQKVWISRVQHSDMMVLLARTTPLADVQKKSDGLSCFLVDLEQAVGKGLTVRPISNMVNHETNELFFDNLEIPEENLLGVEGKGFKTILDGLNAERTLIAAECIGDGYWFIDRAVKYANERVVFNRKIGQNQGVQFPVAEAYIEVEAANLMRWKACQKIDAQQPAGAEANMAKHLAAKASWEAANVCLQTHGGFGFACEYDIERKFRETRLYQVAPISTNMIFSYVAEHVLGLPKSY